VFLFNKSVRLKYNAVLLTWHFYQVFFVAEEKCSSRLGVVQLVDQ